MAKNSEFQDILQRDAKNYIDSNIAGVLTVLSSIIYNEDCNEKTRLTAIQTFLDRSRLVKTEKTEIEVINSPTEIISEIYERINERKQQVIESNKQIKNWIEIKNDTRGGELHFTIIFRENLNKSYIRFAAIKELFKTSFKTY